MLVVKSLTVLVQGGEGVGQNVLSKSAGSEELHSAPENVVLRLRRLSQG
jgi:hypothetical protein